VGGAPVVLAPSWLIVAVLLTVVFMPTVRAGAPTLNPVATALAAAAFPVLLAVSVLLHELGHGLTARRFGIPVTEYVVTLWGGHTQFDRELRSPGVSAAVAVAGPGVNAALAGVSWWAAARVGGVPGLLLDASWLANGFVAAFNLLPGLPLDGGRVLEAAVWRLTGDRLRGSLVAGWAGRGIAIAAVGFGLGWPLAQGRQPTLVTTLSAVLVAALLWAGAGQGIAAARIRRAASGLDLRRLAAPAATVAAWANVAQLDGLPAGTAAVVVDDAGTPVALVDPQAAAGVPPSLRAGTPVAAVATALAPASVVRDLEGMSAVRAMTAAQHAGRAAVLVDDEPDGPRVLGVVLVASVARALGVR
jgi:Zn-dependent protease